LAKRIAEVTDNQWQQVNEFNRKMVEEYLTNSVHLSPKSIEQYKSALRIYFWWVKENLNNKSNIEIKSREYLRYQNWVTNLGLGESAIRFKRSAVSSFNDYVLLYYEEDYPTFRNYITKQIKVETSGKVHKKIPLTPEEMKILYNELEKRADWQKLAYVKFTYASGCRRAEAAQLLKEVVDYKPIKKLVKTKDKDGKEIEVEITKYKTGDIRCKGRGRVGKVKPLEFNQEAMDAIKKWLEERGEDDCPYVFVSKINGKYRQINEQSFNDWCSVVFAKIIGRRVTPHLFRTSRATNGVIYEGKSLETMQKLLGHLSSDTTKIYVVKEDSEDADEAFV